MSATAALVPTSTEMSEVAADLPSTIADASGAGNAVAAGVIAPDESVISSSSHDNGGEDRKPLRCEICGVSFQAMAIHRYECFRDFVARNYVEPNYRPTNSEFLSALRPYAISCPSPRNSSRHNIGFLSSLRKRTSLLSLEYFCNQSAANVQFLNDTSYASRYSDYTRPSHQPQSPINFPPPAAQYKRPWESHFKGVEAAADPKNHVKDQKLEARFEYPPLPATSASSIRLIALEPFQIENEWRIRCTMTCKDTWQRRNPYVRFLRL